MALFGKTKLSYEQALDLAVAKATELAIDSINRKNDIAPAPKKVPFTVALTTSVARLFGRMESSNRTTMAHNSGYNMQRMISAIETEPYVARVVDQLRMGVLQRGYDFC